MAQQPSGELASTDPTKGEEDARVQERRKDFSQCMQQSTTPSTSNVILHRQERTEPFGPQRCRHGTKSLPRREPDVPAELLRALFGNVTKPSQEVRRRFRRRETQDEGNGLPICRGTGPRSDRRCWKSIALSSSRRRSTISGRTDYRIHSAHRAISPLHAKCDLPPRRPIVVASANRNALDNRTQSRW